MALISQSTNQVRGRILESLVTTIRTLVDVDHLERSMPAAPSEGFSSLKGKN